MRADVCAIEVARLMAAFPSTKATDRTVEVYVEALSALRYPEALRDAVDALIAEEQWLPPIALVREEYLRYRDKYLPPALPEPELTEEERRANVERMRALTDSLGRDEPQQL